MGSYYQVVLIGILIVQVLCQRGRQRQSNFLDHETNAYSARDAPQVPPGSSGVACPDKYGRYPTRLCDSYIECLDGVGEEKFCPDGLLFNPAVGPFSFPCQYPIDVNCTGREQTQPPQATEDCPHQFGYFRLGDAANCGQFKNCVDGRGYVFDCPEGLAFNGDTFRCDWPDQVLTCDAEAYLGFTCPPEAKNLGQEEYRYFRSPHDCQKYFICINGRPRMYNCGSGKAFNDLTNVCDGAENVTGCSGAQYSPEFSTSRYTSGNFHR